MPEKVSPQTLAERIRAGDRRATGRAISWIENRDPAVAELLRHLYPHSGHAHLIGITGPPGVGKSSLIDSLLTRVRRDGIAVGVLAVDPSSPFSGGALLGDRIRMIDHTLDPGVFIRSMGSRGQMGGVATATREAGRVLEAFGCRVILIETVGVGQDEWAITQLADTTVLVLNPESGDEIQASKAGIMEVADLYVVNKADLPSATRTRYEVEMMLELAAHQPDWRPPVILTETLHPGRGIDELWQDLQAHRQYLENSGKLQALRQHQLREELLSLTLDMAAHALKSRLLAHPLLDQVLLRLAARQIDPVSAARMLLKAGEIPPQYGH